MILFISLAQYITIVSHMQYMIVKNAFYVCIKLLKIHLVDTFLKLTFQSPVIILFTVLIC